MGKQRSQHHRNRMKSSKDDRIRACCCLPCFAVSSMFKGIGRCMFVTCFPVIQCFGCDDYRHRHHHHHHKHFF